MQRCLDVAKSLLGRAVVVCDPSGSWCVPWAGGHG